MFHPSNGSTMLTITTLFALLLILSSTNCFFGFGVSAQAVDYQGALLFEVPLTEPFTVNQNPVLVTITGKNFSTKTSIRLASNVSAGCNLNTQFSYISTAIPGTISNIFTWDPHNARDFFVAALHPTSYHEHVYVCYTRDGSFWHQATNAQHRSHFKIWPTVPTFHTIPTTLVAHQPAIFVVDGGGTYWPSRTRGVLVTDPKGCASTIPALLAAGGANNVTVTKNNRYAKTFTFTLGRDYSSAFGAGETEQDLPGSGVWLCVSTSSTHDDWSIVPHDYDQIHDADTTIMTSPHRIAPRVTRNNNFAGATYGAVSVHKLDLRHHMVHLSCSEPFIAGVQTECEVLVNSSANATALNIKAEDLTITQLRDGGGIEECPFPVFRSEPRGGTFAPRPGRSQTHAYYFSWTPQRHGNGGFLSVAYKGQQPLLFHPQTFLQQQYFHHENTVVLKRNASVPLEHDTHHDLAHVRFMVEPGYSLLDTYDYRNLMDISYFTPTEHTWHFRHGVPRIGKQNMSNDDEPTTVSLNDKHLQTGADIAQGTISQTVDLPANNGAQKCRMKIQYHYDPKVVDYITTRRIGTVRFILVDASLSETVIDQYEMLYSGRIVRIVGSGASARRLLDGNTYQYEQLISEVHINPALNHAKLKIEVSSENHDTRGRLYFTQAEARCATSQQPRTPAHEVTALKSIYASLNAAAATSGFGSWRAGSGSVFNGDPCLQHWQGVECRHFHVVELRLAGHGLTGVLPSLGNLPYLEYLDISDNKITGALGTHQLPRNTTRLRILKFDNNLIQGIDPALFSYDPHVVPVTSIHDNHECLQVIEGSDNYIQNFPHHILDLPRLHTLNLARNHISGTLRNRFPPHSVLEHVQLQRNRLSGPLPLFENPLWLKSADLSDNNFNGTVPNEWGSLESALFLDVSKNHLNYYFPFELTKIRTAARLTFRAEANKFKGLLPRLPFYSVDLRDNLWHCPLPYNKPEWASPDKYVGLETKEMKCDWVEV